MKDFQDTLKKTEDRRRTLQSEKGGRRRADLRGVADAIFYRSQTGCQWNAIPPELAPESTAHDYYQQWAELGIFEQLWSLAIEVYDELIGLDFMAWPTCW